MRISHDTRAQRCEDQLLDSTTASFNAHAHTHTLCLDLEEHTDTYKVRTFSCKVPKVSKAGAQILGLQTLSMLRNLLSFKRALTCAIPCLTFESIFASYTYPSLYGLVASIADSVPLR